MTVQLTRRSERHAALRALLAGLERNPALPLTEIPEGFADLGDLLATAHQRWHSHLGARVDAALETGDTPAQAVRDAYLETMRALPGVRRLLDAHAGHPVLSRAEERELALLAWAAGLSTGATPESTAASLGRRFRDAARSGAAPGPDAATHVAGLAASGAASVPPAAAATSAGRASHPGRCRWLRRLRHSVAA